jgi:hypothetical protein
MTKASKIAQAGSVVVGEDDYVAASFLSALCLAMKVACAFRLQVKHW